VEKKEERREERGIATKRHEKAQKGTVTGSNLKNQISAGVGS
jgi:hypothetical protein